MSVDVCVEVDVEMRVEVDVDVDDVCHENHKMRAWYDKSCPCNFFKKVKKKTLL